MSCNTVCMVWPSRDSTGKHGSDVDTLCEDSSVGSGVARSYVGTWDAIKGCLVSNCATRKLCCWKKVIALFPLFPFC